MDRETPTWSCSGSRSWSTRPKARHSARPTSGPWPGKCRWPSTPWTCSPPATTTITGPWSGPSPRPICSSPGSRCTGRATPWTRCSKQLRCTHEGSLVLHDRPSRRGAASRGDRPAPAGPGRGPGPGARLRPQPHRLQGPCGRDAAPHRRLPDPAPGRRGHHRGGRPRGRPGPRGGAGGAVCGGGRGAAGGRWGTAAEWTVVPARHASPLADGASFELGASIGVPAMAAHYCLFSDGPVPGQTVLVAGGAGAVGHFAIELAKRAGARVITTVSSSEKAVLAEKAGADLVVNYRSADAIQQIHAFAPAVDRVIELALGANLALDLAVAHPGPTIMTYAAEAADPVLPVRPCMTANVTLKFMLLYTLPAEAHDRAVADITAALAAGDLTGLPVHKYPLDHIVAAHEAAEGGVLGKIIVTP